MHVYVQAFPFLHVGMRMFEDLTIFRSICICSMHVPKRMHTVK